MRDRTRGYVHRVDIGADVAEVWRALVDPALLARWYATRTRIDAREGGSYWIQADVDLTREAHIDVFEPPRRLRLIYMPLPELPRDDCVVVDDFLLDLAAPAQPGARAVTVLRLLGSGIPETRAWDAMYLRLRGGWEQALLRLKVALEKPAPAQRD